MQVATSLPAGALFADDYEIVRPLSVGGMGSLYVARQRSTGKQRALKLMLLQFVANADLRRRFDQEARIASLIQSDHVVEVVGAGVDDATGVPWLAMELLEGTDLGAAIARSGPMTLGETRVVLEQLCHAVAAAHSAGIIHRDLKPENVFLAKGKSAQASQVVKVLDFGIAKIAAEAATKHTAAIGSPLWMAPEQSERGAVTPAADVWAIGLIAFFLLTGRSFWRSDAPEASVQQIMREVLFEPIPPASDRAREHGLHHRLPPWFDAWFGRCVTRDPKERLANATEAYALFDRCCAERDAVSIVPASGSSGSIVVRPPAAGLQTQPDGTNPTGPTIFAADELPPSAHRSRVAESLRRRLRPAIVVAALGALALTLGGAVFVVLHQAKTPAARAGPPPEKPLFGFPPELGGTAGAAWFNRVGARCNPVAVDLLQQQDPPPKGRDGAGFAAACFTLAGKHDRARASLNALAKEDRPFAAWAVFEVVHPIADAGDDASAGPGMLLVLEYWPENYMALYHAGMSEYRTDQPAPARQHLQRFLTLYTKPDGFTAAARMALAELERPSAPGDCATPLTVDPEGKRVFRVGCTPPPQR